MQANTTLLAGKSYVPALDGFRGLAIMVVVISHYGLGKVIPGGFGVTLFFFISGFLITRLLIAEYEKEHRIDLKSFYIRRVLRLYPALFFMVAIAIGFTMFMGCGFQSGAVLSTLFYYRNYYMLFGGSLSPANCTRIFDITWSLSIEEHFYLFFPLLFMAFYRRPKILATLMGISIVSVLAWRLYLVATEGLTELTVYRIYHLTDTRLDAIMFGCLVSLILHQDRVGRYIRIVAHPAVFAGAIGLLFFTFLYRDGTFRETWRYSLQALALSVILPAVLYGKSYTSLMHWLSTPWLVTIGKLSYSLYLFHWVGVSVAENLIGGERLKAPWLLTAVPLGLLLSLLSYNYIEKPTARLRKRFGSTVETAPLIADSTLVTERPFVG
ncbi:acyltransferase family protein [Spirosoma endbachense]|uniref:Acyltransferase family protein n=1 Tax=Spirosoma endbachense TaxID=2666025 RepID=A0A6P1VMY7_9BACT|nr:acyltransferase [Spirosoma endbachense]QHV94065.1 acyltransferase family protein [Spirosoma endbachense]